MRKQTVETQIEFAEWLKSHKMYNQMASAQEMQAMYDVWEQQNNIIRESYEAVVNKHEYYEGDFSTCIHCGGGDFGPIEHSKNCLVTKAKKWLETHPVVKENN